MDVHADVRRGSARRRGGGSLPPTPPRLLCSVAVVSQASKTLVAVVGGLAILSMAALDYLTPTVLRFYLLYWPPIVVVTWHAG